MKIVAYVHGDNYSKLIVFLKKNKIPYKMV